MAHRGGEAVEQRRARSGVGGRSAPLCGVPAVGGIRNAAAVLHAPSPPDGRTTAARDTTFTLPRNAAPKRRWQERGVRWSSIWPISSRAWSTAPTHQTAMVVVRVASPTTELDGRANRLAHHLKAAGVGPGDRVGLQLANGTEYIESMLACFKIRAVPININYRYLPGELALPLPRRGTGRPRSSTGASPRAVARSLEAMPEREGGPGGRRRLRALPVRPRTYEAALATSPAGHADSRPRAADDLYCVYTGGTTGMPKGVIWRHEDIFFAAMGGGDPFSLGNYISFPRGAGDRVLHPGLTALAIPPFMHASRPLAGVLHACSAAERS